MSMDKQGPPIDKITDFLGKRMKVDLKNKHTIIGTLSFYHLTEQMIHMNHWEETDEKGELFRKGRYIVVNRTAWFQLLAVDDEEEVHNNA